MSETGMVKSEQTGIVARATYKFDELEKMADVLAQSKMFGSWDTKAKVLALLLISQTESSNPCIAVQRYFPITNAQGQTSTGKWAKAMHIDFLAAGGEIEWLVTNAQEAKATFTMPGRKPFTFGYTWAQAVRAKLTGKSNWLNHPDDMLRNAVVGKGLRAYHPASTSFMCNESEGIESFNEDVIGAGNGEGDKPTVTPPQAIFGIKGKAGRPKKEEKTVEGTVVADADTASTPPATVPTTPETPVQEAMKEATIPPVVPVSKPEPVEPVVVESECLKLFKTVDQVKLRGVLMGLKYIEKGAKFDTITTKRQEGIVKQWDKFKAKVEQYVQFGTEG